MIFRKGLQWWTGLVLVCLMVSLVFFAFVARRPLCIDSKIVEKIDSLTGDNTATAFRCGLHRHVDFDETLATRSRDLGRRLQKLERLFDWVGPLKSKVQVVIISGAGSKFHIQGHRIEISESLLEAQGQLEKAILKIWFRERANPSLAGHVLTEESLTDFFYSVYSGSLDLQEPTRGIFLHEDVEARWPGVLTTAKGNCLGIWSPIESLDICGKLEDFSDDNGQIDILSLRPLISQTLMGAYLRMKAPEQMALIKKISESLESWKFESQHAGMSALAEKQQAYVEASFELETWIRSLQKISPKFATFFAFGLKGRGFGGAGARAELDTLIFSDRLSWKLGESLRIEFVKGSRKHLLGWIDGEQIQLGFNNEKLDLQLFGEIRAGTAIFFHCGQIDTKTLMAAANRVEKLVYVDSCSLESAKITGFLDTGIQDFAKQNPSVKFIEFHTASLISALRRSPGVNPVVAMGASGQHVQFFRQIGWATPTFDKSVGAFRAQSVIDAIDWYRL